METTGIYRYLVALLPDARTEEQVWAWKRTLRSTIGGFSGSRTIPHITLFFADLELHDTGSVKECLLEGTRDQRSFALHLQGITHFPDRRTIYVDPVEKEAIARLRGSLVAAAERVPVLKGAMRVTDHPHLTIAAGLKPHQFEQAWSMLAPHVHSAEMAVHEVVLLGRVLQPGTEYAPIARFPLRDQ